MNRRTLARMIDHTILNPETTEDDVRRVVSEALNYQFAAVCVNGRWISLVRDLLNDGNTSNGIVRPVLACAVVGFPLGACSLACKAREAREYVFEGAQEIDMVVSLGDLLDSPRDYLRVSFDIAAVVLATKSSGEPVTVKVILETAALTEEQVRIGCMAAKSAGADFVKTSTGFHPKGGATFDAVRWLKKYGDGLKVKAAGGIRSLAVAERMIAAGADRLGCSASVAIVSELSA